KPPSDGERAALLSFFRAVPDGEKLEPSAWYLGAQLLAESAKDEKDVDRIAALVGKGHAVGRARTTPLDGLLTDGAPHVAAEVAARLPDGLRAGFEKAIGAQPWIAVAPGDYQFEKISVDREVCEFEGCRDLFSLDQYLGERLEPLNCPEEIRKKLYGR